MHDFAKVADPVSTGLEDMIRIQLKVVYRWTVVMLVTASWQRHK